MLSKIYLSVGLAICVWLGAAFLLGWKAPNLGFFDGSSGGGGTGRGGFFYIGGGGGGFHYGK